MNNYRPFPSHLTRSLAVGSAALLLGGGFASLAAEEVTLSLRSLD